MILFSNPGSLLWLLAAVVLLVIEGSTVNLVSIWFAVGAVAALFACQLGGSWLTQLTVFTIVSTAALVLTKPLVDKFRRSTPPEPTNGDRNVGRVGTVLTEITPELPGRVRLDGVDWRARTAGAPLAPGTLCRVVALDSAVLIVAPETGDPAQPPVETMV